MRIFRPKYICGKCGRVYGQTQEDIFPAMLICPSCRWGHKY